MIVFSLMLFRIQMMFNVNIEGLVSVSGLRQVTPGLSLAGYRDIGGGSGFR